MTEPYEPGPVDPLTVGMDEARAGAKSIQAALDSFDETVRKAILWDLVVSEPGGVLSCIGKAVAGVSDGELEIEERVARAIDLGALLGDGRAIVEQLGDEEPWLTIRQALWDYLNVIDRYAGHELWPNNVVGIPRLSRPE